MSADPQSGSASSETGPVIVVHGGAWAIPDSLVEPSLLGVQRAANAGYEILLKGGSAQDAVEAAIVIMEDDPSFDAGTGSVLTSAETIEMDSIIMEGTQLGLGAIACVQNIKNPIKLARLVMDTTHHTMLVGEGANKFAVENGIPRIATEMLVTPEAKEELERLRTYNNSVVSNFSERLDYITDNGNSRGSESSEIFMGHETVGCVAMDRTGHLASGTSTGGITGKRPGRVGDSPLVGCGTYADDLAGAVSTTGHGESISKVCLARRIVEHCEKGVSSSKAIKQGLDFMRNRVGQAGGAICIDSKGAPGIGFNTERMAWAIITHSTATSGVNPSQQIPFKAQKFKSLRRLLDCPPR